MMVRSLCFSAIVTTGLLSCTPKTEPLKADSSAPLSVPSTNAMVLPPRQPPASHLIVLLHGIGDNAATFVNIGPSLGEALPRAELVVPDGFQPFDGGGNGRQWFSLRGITETNRAGRVREAGSEVSRWIDAELGKRGLGGDKLVLVGFSQGAIVASWLAVHRAPRPAAVVMLSGRVSETDAPSAGAGPRVFIAHGDRDAVISVSSVDPAARTLEAWGARVTTRVYPGMGHHVEARELRDVSEFLAGAVEAR